MRVTEAEKRVSCPGLLKAECACAERSAARRVCNEPHLFPPDRRHPGAISPFRRPRHPPIQRAPSPGLPVACWRARISDPQFLRWPTVGRLSLNALYPLVLRGANAGKPDAPSTASTIPASDACTHRHALRVRYCSPEHTQGPALLLAPLPLLADQMCACQRREDWISPCPVSAA